MKDKLLNQIRGHINQRQYGDAVHACQRLLSLQADHVEAHFYLGIALGEKGFHYGALRHIGQAAKTCPRSGDYLGQFSRFLYETGHYLDAFRAVNNVIKLGSKNARTLETIACIFTYLEKHQQAYDCFLKVTKYEPNDYMNYYNESNALQFLGRFKESAVALKKTLEINPGFYKAYWSMTQLHDNSSKVDEHVRNMEGMLENDNDDINKEIYLSFALGKEYEDRGEYSRSFNYYQRGCQAKRAGINYSADDENKLYDKIKRTFTPDILRDTTKGDLSKEPIFILGLPRTGTTLADRILASHSQVESAGELRNFRTILKCLQMEKGLIKPDNLINIPEATVIDNALTIDAKELGSRYIKSTRYITGNKPHFIDKLPQNNLYLGLIHRALPNAKILHITRNPMDTCFSNYKQLFAKGCYYSYDLNDLAKSFVAYKDLMAYWHQALPNRIMDISYERLIDDTETEIRKMLDYCELDWETDCLNFHKNKTAVATASSHQVRRPIYNSSVGKWKKYELELQPLIKAFDSNNIDIFANL